MADKDTKAEDVVVDAKSAAPIATAPTPAAPPAAVKAAPAAKADVTAEKPAAPKAAVVAAPAKPAPVVGKAPAPVAPVIAAKPATPVAAPATVAVKAPAKIEAPVKASVKAVAPVAAKKMPTPKKTPTTKPTPIAATAAKATPIKKEAITMESTIKNTTDKAQAMFVDMNDRAKAALEKTQGLFADVTEFNKGNVEALVESSKIAAKGIETMGQDAAEYTRKSFENMTAIVKSLSSVKSPTEFMKLHSDYVRTSFDSMVAESSKTTENMLKLAGEIAQPISNRVAIAAEKIKISA